MPFQTLETYKMTSRLKALCIVTCSLCVAGSSIFAQGEGKPPANQREYDSAQATAVVKLHKLEGLLSDEILTKFPSIAKEYVRIVTTGTNGRNAQELAILKSGLEFKIYSLSDLAVQEDPRQVENATKALERDIGGAGRLIGNADDKKRFRQLMFDQAMPMLKRLIKSNYLARSISMEMMLAMEVVSGRGSTRMQMMDGIDQVFIDVLKDPDQPDAVKIRAANSIKRYLQKADAVPQIENALADALIPELTRKFVGVEYQNYILMALESVRAPRRLVGDKSPFVLRAAVETMSDVTLHIRTRCRAARLAGQQAGLDTSVNWDPIAWKISQLALEASLRFAQAPNQADTEWKYSGWYLYLAFHHADRAGKAEIKGLLNRAPKSQVVLDAFKVTFDVAAYLAFGEGKLAPAIGKLDDWVTKNQPANLVYSPSCPPIKVGGAAAAGGQPGG